MALHAHTGSVHHNDTPVFPAAMATSLLQLFGRVLEDALQSTLVQFVPCLTVRRGGCGGHRHGAGGGKCLDFSDHFLAATVGVENLGEESPEGVLLTEYPPTTEVSLRPVAQFLGRDEGAKALSQLADRVPANPTPFIGQLLCSRTRLTAQGRQVKSGEIKRGVFHTELSQKCFRHAADFARNGLNLVPFGTDHYFSTDS